MGDARQRRVLVTGAASGLGLEAALQLAQGDDHVIVADRNIAGGVAAVERIRAAGGSAEFRELDLADLSRIRAFAADEVARGLALDVLLNNAGLLPPLERATTRDGYELGFGIAYLGHYALTGLLMPALLRAPQPRVVAVSSLSHGTAKLDFDDLQGERRYVSSTAYANSKLCCLLFAQELQRRADAAGAKLTSVAAHPGVASTPIAAGWRQEDRRSIWSRFELIGYNASIRLFGTTAAEGARPLIHAASATGIIGGAYYGPTRRMQTAGDPGRVKPHAKAQDAAAAARLWDVSSRLSGVTFAF